MARQAPVDKSDDAREVQSVEDDSDGGSGTNELQQVVRERRISTPVSVARRNLPAQDNEEVQILKLLQTSASAISSQALVCSSFMISTSSLSCAGKFL
jgi:hypothetical protein